MGCSDSLCITSSDCVVKYKKNSQVAMDEIFSSVSEWFKVNRGCKLSVVLSRDFANVATENLSSVCSTSW